MNLLFFTGLSQASTEQIAQSDELNKRLEQSVKEKLVKIINSNHRPIYRKLRDQYRNPLDTLLFFGIEPTMTVVEIDSTYGWYTDILAPFLAKDGQYIVAGPLLRKARSKLADDKVFYGNPLYFPTSPPQQLKLGEANSADMVVSFRSLHNWLRGDRSKPRQDYATNMFESMFRVLKPGGILGIVQHKRSKDQSYKGFSNGYVNESYAIELARSVGFKLVARSMINRNFKDTKNYPKGVWTLPPALNMGEIDRDKYIAIGESDRFTLKFIKPNK